MIQSMIQDRPVIEIAGEFLAGTLSDERFHHFETRLVDDAEARKAVDQLETRMDAFLGANASDALRAARKERQASVNSGQSEPTRQKSESSWPTLTPGVTGKVLHYDHQVGSMVYIARLEAGARCPAAGDGSPEECLLVSGDFSLDEVTLSAGDHYLAPNSVIHGGGHTEAGAVLLIRAQDA